MKRLIEYIKDNWLLIAIAIVLLLLILKFNETSDDMIIRNLMRDAPPGEKVID